MLFDVEKLKLAEFTAEEATESVDRLVRLNKIRHTLQFLFFQ